MLGAIIGDMIGSILFNEPHIPENLNLYDLRVGPSFDTLYLVSLADIFLKNIEQIYNENSLKSVINEIGTTIDKVNFYKKYKGFAEIYQNREPKFYNYYNDLEEYDTTYLLCSVLIGWIARTQDEAMNFAQEIARISNNQADEILAAQIISLCIYSARKGYTKQRIFQKLKSYNRMLPYYMSQKLDESKVFSLKYNEIAIYSLYCFLTSNSYEDAIKKSFRYCNNSYIIVTLVSAIAEAFYQKDELGELEEDYLEYFINKDIKEMLIKFHRFVSLHKTIA